MILIQGLADFKRDLINFIRILFLFIAIICLILIILYQTITKQRDTPNLNLTFIMGIIALTMYLIGELFTEYEIESQLLSIQFDLLIQSYFPFLNLFPN